ncbi:MAG: HlyD family efflux transporter periplasmic adaptor subunit [Betaproteobacteria bacterium]
MRIRSALLASGAVALLAACSKPASDGFPGYAEADYVRLTAPIAGTLVKLYVQRGDTVEAAAPAFVLEQASEAAARQEAISRVERSRAQLADLQKGKRPDELAAIRAQLAQAEAAMNLARADFARDQKLVADKFISAARLDATRSAVAQNQARVDELRAQLRVAQTGARSDEIRAAERDVDAARAQLAQAGWRVEQKTQSIPVAATVTDVLYREGEYVPAGSPVLTLLPPGNIKARFFVPETQLGTLQPGQAVLLQCDGCGAPIPGTISFIAREAEYTAPIIYSKENRASLVFMVEARPDPDATQRLHPGQPLEVRLGAAPKAAP